MAVVCNHVTEASSSFVSRDDVSLVSVSECLSCAHLKKDLQVLMNELKLVSEIINL
jgi:hypothetical protein